MIGYRCLVRHTLLACLLLTGCNLVFGIRETGPVDATFFDTPFDAPFVCPEIGMPPPRFVRTVEQYLVQDCRELTQSPATGLQLAMCNEPVYGPAEAKAGDVVFTLIPGLAPVNFVHFEQARISPEGDEMFLVKVDNQAVGVRIERYTRAGDSWMLAEAIRDPADVDTIIGQPSAGPDRRMLVYAGGQYVELAIPPSGPATMLPVYDPDQLGVTNFDSYPAHLSPDGLRVVFTARPIGDTAQRVLYTDRPDRSQRFRKAVVLDGAPIVADAVMTPTCDRIYFSGFQSLFYEQQR